VPLERIGVAGAGTMGAGIAQLACLGGLETHLHDPSLEALGAGGERVREALADGARTRTWRAGGFVPVRCSRTCAAVSW
jgi:3-hydroxyacyl-CoA dehydrogenase